MICAYTGDYNQLVYLRTRDYTPSLGRFLTRDTWAGDYNKPMSLNRWTYTAGNPVNFTDSSGMFSVNQIYESFGFSDMFELINAFETGSPLAGIKGRWGW